MSVEEAKNLILKYGDKDWFASSILGMICWKTIDKIQSTEETT